MSTQIPSQWPPNAVPIPAGLENATLDCASGNCTEEAPPPAAAAPALPAGNLTDAKDHVQAVTTLYLRPTVKVLTVVTTHITGTCF